MTIPLSDAHTALWNLLLAEPEFTALIQPGCRIRYDGTSGPEPDLDCLSDADYPRVRILYNATPSLGEHDSTASRFRAHFLIQMDSGGQQQGVMEQVDWAIFKAWSRWKTYLRDATTYDGQTFVSDFRPEKVDAARDTKRGIDNWVTLQSVIMDLTFRTRALGT